MAIETKTDVEKLSILEVERAIATALDLEPVGEQDGVLWVRDGHERYPFSPSCDWNQFGPLMIKYRIALYPTIAWGSGDGVSRREPGWMASPEPGKPIVETDPLAAGCRALLLKIRSRVK